MNTITDKVSGPSENMVSHHEAVIASESVRNTINADEVICTYVRPHFSNKVFRCKKCQKYFKLKHNLDTHMKNIHKAHILESYNRALQR